MAPQHQPKLGDTNNEKTYELPWCAVDEYQENDDSVAAPVDGNESSSRRSGHAGAISIESIAIATFLPQSEYHAEPRFVSDCVWRAGLSCD